MAREMIKNGQLKLAADAVNGIETQSLGYSHGGNITTSTGPLYYASQVNNIVDMAVQVIDAAAAPAGN